MFLMIGTIHYLSTSSYSVLWEQLRILHFKVVAATMRGRSHHCCGDTMNDDWTTMSESLLFCVTIQTAFPNFKMMFSS